MQVSSGTVVLRAIGQLRERPFLGAILGAIGWTALCAIILHGLVLAAVRAWLAPDATLGWLAEILALLLAAALSMWLFLPTAAAIASLYVERIARAVEARYYPWLPPPSGAPWQDQIYDALALAGRLLLLGTLALAFALLLPGLGVVLGWLVTGYALGRGLFVTAAMRRLPRGDSVALYRRHRRAVLVPGLIIAVGAGVPVVNVFVPVLALAAMVHVFAALAPGAVRPGP